MKRDLAAILGLLKRRPRCGGGDATKSPGGPDAAGAKRTKRPRAARLPLRKDSSGVGRRLRSRPLCSPLDRSVQTDAQAKPARVEPDAVERLTAAVERVRRAESPDGHALHRLAFLGMDDAFVDLVDHPAVLPHVRDALGWNI